MREGERDPFVVTPIYTQFRDESPPIRRAGIIHPKIWLFHQNSRARHFGITSSLGPRKARNRNERRNKKRKKVSLLERFAARSFTPTHARAPLPRLGYILGTSFVGEYRVYPLPPSGARWICERSRIGVYPLY